MTEGMERLAAVIEEHEELVENAEKQLKRVKEELLNYQIELAAQMDEKGITTFTTSNGRKISVKDELRVTLLGEDRKRSTDWLEANGLGGILKKQITVSLGRGSSSSPLEEAIRALGLPFDKKDDVPWNTLSKCMRELLEEGRDFDRSCFNVFEQRMAKVAKTRK